MAVYNEIQVGRFNRMLQKLLSMKGPASMNTLAPELVPVLQVFHGAEDRYLEGWDRFGFAQVIPAQGVGLTSTWRFRNPAGTNTIIVLESWTVAVDSNDEVVQSFGTPTNLANVPSLGASGFDARGRPNPSAVISYGNVAADLAGLTQDQLLLATTTWQWIVTENQELPVSPGSGFQVRRLAANAKMWVNVVWRERFLEDSERA